jgi:NAD(P)-dependent dehydrogenase (short-subunit alcohol dehydrogenase family)
MTNAVAPIRVARRLVGQVREGSGVLAFMSSILGSVTIPDGGEICLYKASKAALNSMINSFVVEQQRPDLCVLAMHPGWVKTDMGGETPRSTCSPAPAACSNRSRPKAARAACASSTTRANPDLVIHQVAARLGALPGQPL